MSTVGPYGAVVADAYFELTAEGLAPVPEARSPWAPDMLHGRLLAGLAARALEQDHAVDDEFRLARLTLDMFRSPPMDPFSVSTSIVRNGRRVRAVDVSITCRDVEVARASALLVRAGRHPDLAIWRAPEWNVAAPDSLPAPDEAMAPGGWDLRVLTPDGFWTAERMQLWARDTWSLVAGETMSPLVRVAVASDLPNPMANAGREGLMFINGDLTLYLVRPPRTEWIGLEVAAHIGSSGVAIGSCTLYDVDGPIGTSTVSAITNAVLDLT